MKKFYLFGMTALLCASLFVLGCDDGGGGGGGSGGGGGGGDPILALSDFTGTYSGTFSSSAASLTVATTSLAAGGTEITGVTTAAGGTFKYATVSYTWVYLMKGTDKIGIAFSSSTVKTILLGISAVNSVTSTYGISPTGITNGTITGMGTKS